MFEWNFLKTSFNLNSNSISEGKFSSKEGYWYFGQTSKSLIFDKNMSVKIGTMNFRIEERCHEGATSEKGAYSKGGFE